jgi:hypothetical protein
MKYSTVLTAICIGLAASPALAGKPATPQADSGMAMASGDAQKIAAEVSGGISDWTAFCARPNEQFAGDAKDAAMALKGRKALGAYGAPDVQAVVKYFAVGCAESGARK